MEQKYDENLTAKQRQLLHKAISVDKYGTIKGSEEKGAYSNFRNFSLNVGCMNYMEMIKVEFPKNYNEVIKFIDTSVKYN